MTPNGFFLGAKSIFRPEKLTIPSMDNDVDVLPIDKDSVNVSKKSDAVKGDYCDQSYDCLKDHFCNQIPR